VLFFNGMFMGSIAGHLTRLDYVDTFYPFVAGHGSFELTAIVFSGAAGLRLGYAILNPGQSSRLDSLRQAGRDGHWYANFGYYAYDDKAKTYGPGGKLCKLNLKTGEKLHRVLAADEPIPNRTHGSALTPDETALWISDQKGQKLFVFDATKMPHPDDVTERDLEAIQVDTDDETLITGDYTVSQEADYKILEQDYEDEMTATQALNAEIQKAAEDLAVRMDDQPGDATTEMPLATVHELDVTAQMPAKDEQEISDEDDTGINPTVSMDADGDTVEMRDENTVEMPKDGSKAG